MIGYGIFLGCATLLGGICLSTRRQVRVYEAKSMIYGGGSTGNLTLTFSVLAAWMWTTSVFGSAETYALYGIWGPVSYVLGACIAFAGLIAVLVFLRKRFPEVITWLGYLQKRYGMRAKTFYYLFAVIVPAYVLIEQGVGIAYVLEDFYGSSFRIISFLSVLIATGYVFFGGMKAVLREEQFTAVILLTAFAAGVVFVLTQGESVQGLEPQAPGSPGLAAGAGLSALRYFIMAIVIAFGQIVFDPAYYLKADLAKSTGGLTLAYILGGIVLWGGITLASSLYLGRAAYAGGVDVTDLFTGPARIIFSIVIIFIGISTIVHFMIGFLGVFSMDLYETVNGSNGTDRDKIVFGRILIVAMGLFCASMTIALENISLLTIDVFCAIFFAAPCVPLLIGIISQRNFGKLPVISVVAGIIGGLIVWMSASGGISENQFAGMGASLLIPLIIMMGGYVKRLPYDG